MEKTMKEIKRHMMVACVFVATLFICANAYAYSDRFISSGMSSGDFVESVKGSFGSVRSEDWKQDLQFLTKRQERTLRGKGVSEFLSKMNKLENDYTSGVKIIVAKNCNDRNIKSLVGFFHDDELICAYYFLRMYPSWLRKQIASKAEKVGSGENCDLFEITHWFSGATWVFDDVLQNCLLILCR